MGHDSQATVFRSELNATLHMAGLRTQFHSGWERAVGLKIAGQPTPQRERVVNAFRAAGLEFVVEPPGEFAKNDLVVIVGTKPEPIRWN